jgi:glycosyltransferase involved in cell wall biosynthesis
MSYSVIQNDVRVRKWANTLFTAGYSVTTIGLAKPGTDRELPWNHIQISLSQRISVKLGWPRIRDRLLHHHLDGLRITQSIVNIITRAVVLRLFPSAWSKTFYHIFPEMNEFKERIIEHGPSDLWIANDWNTLPLAVYAQDQYGGKIIYDSHEYAVGQFQSQRSWRIFTKPLVQAVESQLIGKFDQVSSVSEGICNLLFNSYALNVPVRCIRNLPPYQVCPFRKTSETIQVLYQGVLAPGRGLEILISAVSLCQRPVRLTIRGPENKPGYVAKLLKIIEELGVKSCVRITPPIPVNDLVSTANEADIGVLFLPNISAQTYYALPNKIFEYMMAGLMVMTSSQSSIKELITSQGIGLVLNDTTPKNIAKTWDELAPETIDSFKIKSLESAKKYNWENEKEKLLSLCFDLTLPFQ